MPALALDLDSVLADTRPLWEDWLEDVARRAHVEGDVPHDRIEAAALLDERLGDWGAPRALRGRSRAVSFRPNGAIPGRHAASATHRGARIALARRRW